MPLLTALAIALRDCKRVARCKSKIAKKTIIRSTRDCAFALESESRCEGAQTRARARARVAAICRRAAAAVAATPNLRTRVFARASRF